MNETVKILEMIERGKITAAEGMELLKAMEQVEPEAPVETNKNQQINSGEAPRKNYKTLKIKVFVEKDDVNVNVNIPLNLVKIVGSMAKDITKFIPNDAREKMEANGVDLTSIDFEKLIKALEDGTLEDPSLVDIDISSKEEGKVKVNIYVE
jgi:DUF4097 and DUF4098 domain-containing protein YvlB